MISLALMGACNAVSKSGSPRGHRNTTELEVRVQSECMFKVQRSVASNSKASELSGDSSRVELARLCGPQHIYEEYEIYICMKYIICTNTKYENKHYENERKC